MYQASFSLLHFSWLLSFGSLSSFLHYHYQLVNQMQQWHQILMNLADHHFSFALVLTNSKNSDLDFYWTLGSFLLFLQVIVSNYLSLRVSLWVSDAGLLLLIKVQFQPVLNLILVYQYWVADRELQLKISKVHRHHYRLLLCHLFYHNDKCRFWRLAWLMQPQQSVMDAWMSSL